MIIMDAFIIGFIIPKYTNESNFVQKHEMILKLCLFATFRGRMFSLNLNGSTTNLVFNIQKIIVID